MPGMITSMITMSGRSRLAAAMPSSALAALLTRCPFFSSSVVNTRTSVGESSMIKICAIVSPLAFGWPPRLLVADMPPDCSEQLFARERLGQVLLRTDDTSARLVEQAVFGRQHDHWRGLEYLVVLDQRAGLVAVKPRHHDVDKNDVRLLIGNFRQRLEPVGCGDDVATFLLEQGFGGAANGFRVVDDHDLEAGHTAIFRCLFHVQPPQPTEFQIPALAYGSCRRRHASSNATP